MPIEIERKFLVCSDAWRGDWPVTQIRQGYLATSPSLTVRVRRAGAQAFLTIKGRAARLVRPEFEYAIPVEDAEILLDTLCSKPAIEKRRHHVNVAGTDWVVDEFGGRHAGLVMAEIELTDPDQIIALPAWAGAEVTFDPRYQNANLARQPWPLVK